MDGKRPPSGYVICSEPRSGTSFLGELLESTGALGHPLEFFSWPAVRAEVRRDPERGLARMVERASTPNGIYGLKLFSYQFDVMTGSGWAERLPGLRFVHMERRDLLGQAISYLRAIQTGQYRSTGTPRRPATYDRSAIAAQIAAFATNQARWRRYFARNAIEPLWLVYEEVAADPAAAVAAVARHVGLADAPEPDAGGRALAVQRDALSDEWRRRFAAEAADLTYLDAGRFGRLRRRLRRARELAWPPPELDKKGWP
jgi:LPS sulfotransferase NodH